MPLPNLGHDESNVSLWMSNVPIVTSTTLTTLLAHFHEFIHCLVLLGLSIVQFTKIVRFLSTHVSALFLKICYLRKFPRVHQQLQYPPLNEPLNCIYDYFFHSLLKLKFTWGKIN